MHYSILVASFAALAVAAPMEMDTNKMDANNMNDMKQAADTSYTNYGAYGRYSDYGAYPGEIEAAVKKLATAPAHTRREVAAKMMTEDAALADMLHKVSKIVDAQRETKAKTNMKRAEMMTEDAALADMLHKVSMIVDAQREAMAKTNMKRKEMMMDEHQAEDTSYGAYGAYGTYSEYGKYPGEVEAEMVQ